MSKKRQKEKAEKTNADEHSSKSTGPTPDVKAQTFDEYQCSGSVELDFPALCALLGVNHIPAVSTDRPASPPEAEGGETEDFQTHRNVWTFWSKPKLQVELESEDAKNLKVSGWTVDERILAVLQKMRPSLKLQSVQFWQAGLTQRTLKDAIALCCSLRSVTLEGNHVPEQSYHLLLSADSLIAHLSLRNNRIGDAGARLIGSALSTTRCSNRKLLSLNLAFNSIADAGAAHIAQGLRFNRTLLLLSLCNNQIGDSGAARLAAVLGRFALTHEEVVERRKMLLERSLAAARVDSEDLLLSAASSSSLLSKASRKKEPKRDKKPAKENPKPNKKPSDVKLPLSKGGRQSSKEKQLAAQEETSSSVLNDSLSELGEPLEEENPLLDQLENQDGELRLPGNKTLTSLNLAGNSLTEASLPAFLTSVEMQGEGGLLRLFLQRNRFPPQSRCYVRLQQLMALKDPLHKVMCEQREAERSERALSAGASR